MIYLCFSTRIFTVVYQFQSGGKSDIHRACKGHVSFCSCIGTGCWWNCISLSLEMANRYIWVKRYIPVVRRYCNEYSSPHNTVEYISRAEDDGKSREFNRKKQNKKEEEKTVFKNIIQTVKYKPFFVPSVSGWDYVYLPSLFL